MRSKWLLSFGFAAFSLTMPAAPVYAQNIAITAGASLKAELVKRVPSKKWATLPSDSVWLAGHSLFFGSGSRCVSVATPDSIAILTSGTDTTGAGSWSIIDGTRWMTYWLTTFKPDTLWGRVVRAKSCGGRGTYLLALAGDIPFSIEIGRASYRARSGSQLDSLLLVTGRDTSFVGTGLQLEMQLAVDAARETREARARAQSIRQRGWPKAMADAAISRRVVPGMTPSMVREAWGEPSIIVRSTTAQGVTETWRYGLRAEVDLRAGKVFAIREINP